MIVLTGCDGPVWERAPCVPQVCEHRCRRDAFPRGPDVADVTIDQIKAARDELRGTALVTPMEGSRWLERTDRQDVWLKCENLQRTGSFKIRGAYLRISQLTRGGARPRSRGRQRRQPRAGGRPGGQPARHQGDGVHAERRAHSQGEGHPGLRRRGARSPARRSTSAWCEARAFAAETGAVLIHPFDHVDIVAGQGTCGLEILEQCPDVQDRDRADRRRRLPGRHRDGGQGAASRRPGDRGAGRGGCGVPRVAGGGPPGAAGQHGDDGRRHRSRLPRRGAVRRGPDATSTRSARSRRSRCRVRCWR